MNHWCIIKMKLRVSINCKRIEGPYGGGNQFVKNLENLLLDKGHKVFRELVPRLDVILIVSSKPNYQTTSYFPLDISRYLFKQPNTLVIHRINTCDEQRALDLGINNAVLEVNRLAAHHTVFVSRFIRDLFVSHGINTAKPHGVILTGADEKVFNPEGRAAWRKKQKLKIVTHHWSKNYLKGFDIYEHLDLLLEKEPFKHMFEFTIIGNIPIGIRFKNTCLVPILSGVELAKKLKEHHLYVTGARYEPAGNHYIEAMRCGLPVLYLESGSSGEYCSQYGGVGYNLADFEERLLSIHNRLDKMRSKVLECPYSAEKMASEYESLFVELANQRREHPLPRPRATSKIRILLRTYLTKLRN